MGFFDKLIAAFSGGNDPASLKKKRLNQIAKALKQSKYAKFYKVKNGELDPLLAKFFYDIYKTLSASQTLLTGASKSAVLKSACVEAFLDDEGKSLLENLSGEALGERACDEQGRQLAEKVTEEMKAFRKAFDSSRMAAADKCYGAVSAFAAFAAFDFFLLLKKFDPQMRERNFSYNPKFRPVAGNELADSLKDFMELSSLVEAEPDWKPPLAVLKQFKNGIDVVNPEQWGRVLRLLRDLGHSRSLEYIIQLITRDPVWQPVVLPPGGKIAAAFVEAKQAEIEGELDKIRDDKRSAQIDQLAKTIFGTADVQRLEFYNVQTDGLLRKKNFEGWTKTAGLNYLKAFLLDFFKVEIKELCDLLLVRGQWTSSDLSLGFSDSFHRISELLEKFPEFDSALSDKGDHGARLKQALAKVDRDRGQVRYIRIILNTVNNEAQRMINTACSNFTIIGKDLKILFEDVQKKLPERILNWKELGSASETPLPARIAADYKKLVYFVQLLRLFVEPVKEDES